MEDDEKDYLAYVAWLEEAIIGLPPLEPDPEERFEQPQENDHGY